jgi:hypothetical protein
LNGAAPDYSGFENMPGYQFAIQQGTQAAERAASAQGSAYTPNTSIAVGNYVTGTAMQDYNTYISQLMGTAGLGSTANQNLQGAQLQTSGNISQLQQNTGQAAASAYTRSANAGAGQIGNIISALLGSGGNNSGSGGGVMGSIANWLKGEQAAPAAGLGGAIGAGIGNLTDPNNSTDPLLNGTGVNPGSVDPSTMDSVFGNSSGYDTVTYNTGVTSGVDPGYTDPGYSDPVINP